MLNDIFNLSGNIAQPGDNAYCSCSEIRHDPLQYVHVLAPARANQYTVLSQSPSSNLNLPSSG